ncbi:protein bfr2-like [Sitophilus oryzae]|uniref:Protein bfr2-like n=1 Tax=Sitophilus oryzae TaxID=7048 RepID=A0A6J2YX19_SITOR|nr:protein bfr2-like [Sitophilus oryzae]
MQMCLVIISVASLSISAQPIKDELMFEGPGDTATVESTVREARAAPGHISDLIKPGVKDAFLYVYGDAENDDGDVHGYSKKTNDKGQDGYKHFDSFHKKDGDKYGYEKHTEFGQDNRAFIENENDKAIKESDAESGGDDDKEDDGEETKKSYTVFTELDSEDKKQPKRKAESEYDFFGGGGSGTVFYEGESSSDKAEGAESNEAAEDDEGSAETEEGEEAEEEEEESEY